MIPTVVVLALVAFLIFLMIVYIGATPAGQRKFAVVPLAALNFLLSRDFTGARLGSPDDAEILLKREVRRKKIYFIRHGESAWNVMFNRGFGFSFLPNLISGLIDEVQLLATGESSFLDSPLSAGGVAQAGQLRDWLETVLEDPHGEFLRSAGPEQLALCCSNLRRAASTGVIGLAGRLLKNKNEKMHVISCLQEATRNIDGVSLTAAGAAPGASLLEKNLPELEPVVERIFRAGKLDGGNNFGTRPFSGRNVYSRFSKFCDWTFNSEAARNCARVAACGHSLWLREFMKAYLPRLAVSPAKTHKLVNCGVLSFDLVDCGGGDYAVDPHSILSVYGGFEGVNADSELKNRYGGVGFIFPVWI